MCQGLDTLQALGTEAGRTRYLVWLAEAYGKVGQVAEGLTVADEALATIEKTGERDNEAELHRVKGDMLLRWASDHQGEAEGCFHHALAIARRQEAKSWELRAATSLARLWQLQENRQNAYDLLAPVYEWFTEGFDTADLIDAKTFLDELPEDTL